MVYLRHPLVLLVAAAVLAGCAATPERPPRQPQAINPTEQRCLALAMYWEARGEGDRGMLAVGSVVLNRMESPKFPNSACAVVKQGGETPPCQFSWWCDGRSDVPRDRPQWHAALANADHLLRTAAPDPTHGALFFHSTAIDTPWLRNRQRTARIGQHVFYR